MPPFNKKPTLNPQGVNGAITNLPHLISNNEIVTAAKAYIEADVHVTPGSNTYKLSKEQGTFARVAVGTNDGGGYAAILKKVYGTWVVVTTGQDLPGKATGEKYGLPADWYTTDY
jgi:hypothetical protein